MNLGRHEEAAERFKAIVEQYDNEIGATSRCSSCAREVLRELDD
jgi:hypothetical protein